MAKAFSLIDTNKSVSETLADLRRLFKLMGVEEYEPIPGDDGRSYSVRYLQAPGSWMEIGSRLQPTKAMNLRACYQVIQYLRLWRERGISGLVQGVSFVGGLVPTKPNRDESFDEACTTLGVEPASSMEEITRVYHVKAQFAHPDSTKGTADEERFKRIQRAYALICKVKGVDVKQEVR